MNGSVTIGNPNVDVIASVVKVEQAEPNLRTFTATRSADIAKIDEISKMGDREPTHDVKDTVKDKLAKFRNAMRGELSNAMRNPKSEHGGPVRISSGTPMKFPYTFTAKIMQFPWMFYIRNNWIWKYYFIAVLVSMPLFKKLSNMSNTPANKAKWAEIRQKDKQAHH